ncbi:Cytochrome p450 [Globisporangium polare]
MLSVDQLVASVEAQPAAVVVSAAIGALFAASLLLRLTQQPAKHKIAVPASYLPILKNTLDLMFYQKHRLYDWITDECEAANGKPWIRAVIGSAPTVMVSTPELFEDILKTQFEDFHKGDVSYFNDLFGKGILASDDEAWVFHRKTASNLFSNQMMRDVMYAAVREKVAIFCDTLREYESRGEPISFKTVMMHYTSDVFGKIGFGVDLQCLENGVDGKPGNEFIKAFATSTQIIFLRLLQPRWLWKMKQYLNIGSERVNSENQAIINEFIFRIINESIAAKKKKESESESLMSDGAAQSPPPKDLISLYLESKVNGADEFKGKAFDSELHLIRDTVFSFIFAGKDTTSHSMSFFIVMMNKYPHVLAKIREELREKLPRSPTGELQVPSMDDLPQLVYLEATVRENQRLNPTVPGVGRHAKKDLVLCDGTFLAKGDRVGLSMYSTGRMKSIWGEDVLEFKPERWIDQETGKLLVVSPFKANGFLAGRRNCIGMKFAMMEIKCTLAVLLSQFDFQLLEDPWETKYEVALTMAVKGPMTAKISSLADKGMITAPAQSA